MEPTKNMTWWAPIAHFAGHTIVGSTIFVIIAIPAIFLGMTVRWAKTIGVSHYTLQVLDVLEHAILTVDAVVFVVYLTSVTWKAIKESFK